MDLVENKIRAIVKRILNEEYGINDEVYKKSNEILERIKNDIENKINNGEFRNVFDEDTKIIRGAFSLKMNGYTVLITYNSYQFKDNDSYMFYRKKYARSIMNAHFFYDDGNPSLFVVYNKIGNKYDDSIYDRVQHELEHCFQSTMKHGDLLDSPLRNRVDKGLKMKNKDINVYMASWILYCSRRYEQDACANGLYSWLMNGGNDKEKIIENSAIVRNRRICIKYIDLLSKLVGNKKEEENIFNTLGITLDKVLKKGCNTVVEMKNKANRIIFKYGKDTGNKLNFIKYNK